VPPRRVHVGRRWSAPLAAASKVRRLPQLSTPAPRLAPGCAPRPSWAPTLPRRPAAGSTGGWSGPRGPAGSEAGLRVGSWRRAGLAICLQMLTLASRPPTAPLRCDAAPTSSYPPHLHLHRQPPLQLGHAPSLGGWFGASSHLRSAVSPTTGLTPRPAQTGASRPPPGVRRRGPARRRAPGFAPRQRLTRTSPEARAVGTTAVLFGLRMNVEAAAV